MADLTKFEEMLERLINEDREGAEELFHDIVVEKSRSIYESLLEDDDDIEEETDEETDEEVDEAEDSDDDEEVDEGFNLDEFEVEADDEFGGDQTDDMMQDLGMDDEGDEGDEFSMDDEGDEGDVEDRVEDLEDALEQLKAEFEQLMSGEEADDDVDMDVDADDEADVDMDVDADDEETEEDYTFEEEEEDDVDEGSYKKKSNKSSSEEMREYVEKVSSAKMGDHGTNTKSAVASPNKMGDGTTANIARNDVENGVEANKGKLKGSALNDQTAKEDSAGNINVPGGKAGKTAFKKTEPGHGAEKKGKADAPASKSSLIGSKKK